VGKHHTPDALVVRALLDGEDAGSCIFPEKNVVRRDRDRLEFLPLSLPTPFFKGETMPKGPLSKSALVQTLADRHSDKLTRKDVKSVLESIVEVGHQELKKTGTFVLPGLVRMLVVKKPATKERKGINPFTGQPTVFKAKPARKVIKARPVKAAKDAIA
jgi:DNA-binding protein HU-beta